MKIQVSSSQRLAHSKGKPFVMSASQLQGNPKKGKQHEIEVSDDEYQRLSVACKKNKGCKISGGSILNDIKSGLTKAGNTITGGIKVGGKELSSNLKSLSKTAKKQDWGGKIEALKKVVPKSVVEAGLTSILIANGADPDAAAIMSSSATSAAYNVDFGENLDGQGGKAAQGAVTGAITGAISSAGSGFHGRKGRVSQHPKGLHQNARDDVKEPVYSGRGLVNKNISHGYLQPYADPNIQFGGKGFFSGGSMIANGKGLYSGSGTKRPKLVKGSELAKKYMESIRRKRK